MNIEKIVLLRGPLLFLKNLGHEEPHPPVELLYLASALGKFYSVSIIDAQSQITRVEDVNESYQRAGMDDSEIGELILKEKPQVVGISVMWANQKNMFDHMVGLIKSIDREIIIVAGGLLPSSVPDEILKNPDVDYVIIGEGERSLPALLENLEKGKRKPDIAGLAFRDGEKVLQFPKELIEDLDCISPPAYRFVDFKNYNTAHRLGHVKKWPFVGILPTRGCTYTCSFCSLPAVSGCTYRTHSIERVIWEMEMLKRDYAIQELHFYDANLLNDAEFAKGLFREMIRRKIDLPWVAEAGLSIWTLDDELLSLAVESGMYRLDLPIESGSRAVRRDIMKKDFYDEKKIEAVIQKARALNIDRVYGYVILGNPGETQEDILKSLCLINALDLDYRGIRCAKPFPGTYFYEVCWEKGYLPKGFSYEELWFAMPTIETKEFSKKDLQAMISADRALALIRREIQPTIPSVIEIFRKWGRDIGIRALAFMIRLSFLYWRQGIGKKGQGRHEFREGNGNEDPEDHADRSAVFSLSR